jgi:hypothetical protein
MQSLKETLPLVNLKSKVVVINQSKAKLSAVKDGIRNKKLIAHQEPLT